MEVSRATRVLDATVTLLQMSIAGLLVVVLFLGVATLAIDVGGSLVSLSTFEVGPVLGLVNSTIDLILYLFIVVELYRTIIAYVDARNVVLAVVHAGLIAVVRQIITFKPAEYSPQESLLIAGVYAVLLLVLLVGFFVVHEEEDEDEDSTDGDEPT